jgi:hypothetical protein
MTEAGPNETASSEELPVIMTEPDAVVPIETEYSTWTAMASSMRCARPGLRAMT